MCRKRSCLRFLGGNNFKKYLDGLVYLVQLRIKFDNFNIPVTWERNSCDVPLKMN